MELVTPGLGLIFWQLVVFISVVFVLAKFAWKPILSSLKERETSIENALLAAEKAKAELENLNKENERVLAEARKERDRIISEAQVASSALINEAKEVASKQGAIEFEKARLLIENEKKAAIAELKNTVSSLSLEIAEKVIRQKLDSDASHQQLVASYLTRLETSHN